MLKFIGNGSAFNYKLGNNSAYILDSPNKEIIIIDCGGSTFERIMRVGVLGGTEKVNVIITHLHPDHVGSLGDLIFYNYYIRGIVTSIYYPGDEIVQLLSLMDVNAECYTHSNSSAFTLMKCNIKSKVQRHRGNQKAFGYLIKNMATNVTIFYSGDSKTIDPEILKMLESEELDLLYQDVSSSDFEANPHISMKELLTIVPADLRYKVVCMHLDGGFDFELAEEKGFKVSKNIFWK